MDAFEKTADDAELLFATDADDSSYDDLDFRGHRRVILDPRPTLTEKLNLVAAEEISRHEHIMWSGDDHVFVTPHWDTLLLGALKDLGGSGWVYPGNGRRTDVPETWLVSSDVIRALGWFANPVLKHYYIDNSIADLGKRSGLIRYCPEALIEHRHYAVHKETVRDALYAETEERWGASDLKAFQEWRSGPQVAVEVSLLRRNFNPDVQWVLSRVEG
jgi:hypothetical protein